MFPDTMQPSHALALSPVQHVREVAGWHLQQRGKRTELALRNSARTKREDGTPCMLCMGVCCLIGTYMCTRESTHARSRAHTECPAASPEMDGHSLEFDLAGNSPPLRRSADGRLLVDGDRTLRRRRWGGRPWRCGRRANHVETHKHTTASSCG